MGMSTEADQIEYVVETYTTDELIDFINEGEAHPTGWIEAGSEMIGKNKVFYSTPYVKKIDGIVHTVCMFRENDYTDWTNICGLDGSIEALTSLEVFVKDFKLTEAIQYDVTLMQTL